MRIHLKDAIRRSGTIVGDGGMGTQLQLAGLEPGGCGDEWNLSQPDKVLAIQKRYVDAGSQVILTNTFGSNHFILARYEQEDNLREICRAGARIARQAAGDDRWVLGDVGPCGGFLEPLGEITKGELDESLRETITALLEGGVDGIIFETVTAVDEMEAAIRIAKQLGAPVIVASMAYDKLRDGSFRTMMGVTPEQAATAAVAAGANVVAANCGTGLAPREFADIGRKLKAAAPGAAVMLQPNAGQPRLEGSDVVYPLSPEEMADDLVVLAAEAQIVGACCGSTPGHIAAFAKRLAAAAKA